MLSLMKSSQLLLNIPICNYWSTKTNFSFKTFVGYSVMFYTSDKFAIFVQTLFSAKEKG